MSLKLLLPILLITLLFSCQEKIEKVETVNEQDTVRYPTIPLEQTPFSADDTTMVNILEIDPDFIIDVRYATDNNFTGQVLYPSSNVFLRKIVAENLAIAHKEAKSLGYRFKIYDGYRPIGVQWMMWALIPDERYVADPRKGSRHNRGAAVDLTLVDANGNGLDMGTEFDDFSDKAAPEYMDLPEDVIANRSLLIDIMYRHGFLVYYSEWWHYDFDNWEYFNIINFDVK